MTEPNTQTLGEQVDAIAERVTEMVSELDAKDQEITRLRKALSDLVLSHNGYQHGLGLCICAAHEGARLLLRDSR